MNSRFDVSSLNGVKQFAVDITISYRLFVFSQSRSMVSAGLTNVSGVTDTAFDLFGLVGNLRYACVQP